MHPCFAGDGHRVFTDTLLPLLIERFSGNGAALPTELMGLFSEPLATHRTMRPAHITTSCVLLNREKNQVLLLFHKKIGEWVYPGGHADGDWHLLRSALRECFEETGLSEVEVLPPLFLQKYTAAELCPHIFQRYEIKAHGNEPAHAHYDAVFVCRALSHAQVSHDPAEADAVQWISREALEEHARRESGVHNGLDALTARICLAAMQSALGH